MDLQEFSGNIERLTTSLDQITTDLYLSYKPDFIDLNEDALDVGEDVNGDKLPEYRSPEYESLKMAIGSRSGGHWDLKLEGNFRRAMDMTNEGIIYSKDSKMSKFTSILGDTFMGVQAKRLDPFIKEQILPDFDSILRKSLGIS